MSRYIDADKLEGELFRDGIAAIFLNYPRRRKYTIGEIRGMLKNERIAPTADVVEVVRCKDCKHFQPCFVMTADGERRPYTEEEIKKGKMVTGDIGINCGSRCERFGYWEENKIPVWYSENDFCSYGERREG